MRPRKPRASSPRSPSVVMLGLVLYVGALSGAAMGGEPFFLDPEHQFTSNPAVAAAPGGGFAAVWTRDGHVPLPFGPDAFVPEAIAVRRLTGAGEPQGGPRVVLGRAAPGTPVIPQLGFSNAGRLGLLWARVLVTGEAPAFVIESRTAQGAGFGPRTTVGACEAGQLMSLRVAAAGEGFWAAWRERCEGTRILAQRLDRNGRPAGPVVLVARGPGLFFDLAAVPGGGFAAAWVERTTTAPAVAVAQIIRASGRPRGPRFQLGPDPVEPSVGALPPATLAIAATPERILVAWRNRDSNLLLRSFGLNGAPLGPPRSPAPDSGGSQEFPRLTCCAGDEAVLTWRRVAGPLSESTCWARRIDLDGRPLGAETLLAEGCLEAPVAVSEDGSLLAVWSATFQQGENHFRRVQARLLEVSDLN
jgi:hypothetical protein